jgi:DNA-binding transcriptional MerR regulator
MTMGGARTVIAAFTEEEVQRLTGISLRQLRYWKRTSFFTPSLTVELIEGEETRLYSFRDLVCLQVLDRLRNASGVSLQHLRDVKDRLSDLGDDVWAKTTLYVLKKRIVFHNPETGSKEEVLTGQGVLSIPLEIVRADMERSVRNLRTRSVDTVGRVQTRKGLAKSKPVVAGTGIQVASIKAYAEAGYSIRKILEEYPALTERDVEAALAHVAAA